MKKFTRAIVAVMAAIFCLQTVVFADSGGDSNIDNGGGNLLDGSQGNFWNPGNDGVRVTIVDSETGAVKSNSIDYSNTNVSDISFHFGKKCKIEYMGGASLSVSTENYSCSNVLSFYLMIFKQNDTYCMLTNCVHYAKLNIIG